jgi:uncharacterized membrane protein YeaQ/YmgE (transglycosylase-associated protein family)
MGVIAWIAIGLIAGWLAGRITDSPRGLLRNLAVGLIGSIVGGFLARKLGPASSALPWRPISGAN